MIFYCGTQRPADYHKSEFTMLTIYLRRAIMAAFPAIAIFCAFSPYRKRALQAMGLHSGRLREVSMSIFISTIAGILALTLRPYTYWQNEDNKLWGDLVISIARPSWNTSLNLVPLLPLFDFTVGSAPMNIMGNTLIFVPIGFGVSALFRNATLRRASIVGFVFSLFIEICQYFLVRVSDVNDLILNTLGSICGYCLYMLVGKKWPNIRKLLACQEIKEQNITDISIE